MEPPVVKTRGIILKKAELSDSVRLLTVYTEKMGKILVRAKGVGKRDSKLKGMIEPFNVYEFLLAKSKNIAVLANVYPEKEFIYLRNHLESLSLAIYFCDLIDKLVFAPERDVKIWTLLSRAMEFLNKPFNFEKEPHALLLNNAGACIKTAFEEKLLEFLGQATFKIGDKKKQEEKNLYLNSLAGEEIRSFGFLEAISKF
ncbi:MAG: DNA repair protein RecO [Candidatus Portnoybacteria bacterium]|nr:DNA repair protein RecO [Candidatus Portnoybacteria bacterium]